MRDAAIKALPRKPGQAAQRRRRCLVAVAWLVALGGSGAAAAEAWPAIADGAIVLFRHADAPGVGDPPGHRIGDCTTQRNLDDAGREQARRIGQAFRARKVPVQRVLSSQWCRTRETAELAFPGLVRDEPLFNSFFEDRNAAPAQTAAALALLKRWRGPGVLVVVTHQVNITALTGSAVASGEGLVVRVGGKGLELQGRLQP
jgi:phosphohistidine phosphatase SixA